MTRSPLAYPLNRSADMDAGGAADLQTDIMRFMAILSLCLVAIFALVQSLPIAPPQPPQPVALPPASVPPAVPAAEPVTKALPTQPALASAAAPPVEKAVTLTRPKWVPEFTPKKAPLRPLETTPEVEPILRAEPVTAAAATPPPVAPETEGFTLRFESDAALTRLVAASTIGLYAIEKNRAQRMTVSDSRISFWDASTPNTFHEMETSTVPGAVVDALSRTGAAADGISWGVTLPGKLKTQLDKLMQEHRGGALIIAASGDIRWETS